MPITYQVDQAEHLITATVSGPVEVEQLFAYINAIWARADQVHFDQLVIIDPATEIHISDQDLDRAARLSDQHNTTRQTYRIALVAPADPAFERSRMYRAYSAFAPGITRVFRTAEAALAWLRQPDR